MTRYVVCAIAMVAITAPAAARQADQEEERESQRGFVTLSLGVGGSGYNRVEGVPFHVGPVGRSEGPNPFQAQALLILRSDRARSLDQVAYTVRGEKLLGGARRVVLGVGFHSEVRPIDDRGLSTIDNSLGTFIVHDDQRDYHNAQGVTLYGAFVPRRSPFLAAIEFRTERHDVVPQGTPGSVIHNRQPWRPQPMVAEGKVHSISAGVRFDNRPRRRGGLTGGWRVEAEVTKALGGDLVFPEVRPTPLDPTDPPIAGIPDLVAKFTIGTLDVRRYTPLGNARLNLRFVAGGALSDGLLPPQFQVALAGRGTLPGFPGLQEATDAPVHAMDCGARSTSVASTDLVLSSPTLLFPSYGCDRYALFQAQLEGYFGFQLGGDELAIRDPGGNINLELVPRWVVFFDAGQAWARGNLGPFARADEDRRYDAGAGVAFGDLGFFVAIPLNGDDREARLLGRFGSRF